MIDLSREPKAGTNYVRVPIATRITYCLVTGIRIPHEYSESSSANTLICVNFENLREARHGLLTHLVQRRPSYIPRGFVGTPQRGDRALDGADIDLREFVRRLRRSDSEEAAFVGVAHAVAPHA